MLVDANILLYSVDETSPFHAAASTWLTSALNGRRRVGLPWISLTAFLRIATNPRALRAPLHPHEAWTIIDRWLAAPMTWIPAPGQRHGEVLRDLTLAHDVRAGLVTDAVLATLCVEHGLEIGSADSDFARFTEITWINPVAEGRTQR
jgi:toxin-antitoxin system PIN domain toxin